MANKMTLEYLKQNYNNYEDRILAAFVGKPEKYFFYKRAFSKYNVNGIDHLKWVWSWWAFLGNWAFLVYRKTYLWAVIFFVLSLIPYVNIISLIVLGGTGIYFVYQKYKKLKFEIENTVQDEDERLKMMIELGGYNSWIAWVAGIIIALEVLIVLAVAIPKILAN